MARIVPMSIEDNVTMSPTSPRGLAPSSDLDFLSSRVTKDLNMPATLSSAARTLVRMLARPELIRDLIKLMPASILLWSTGCCSCCCCCCCG